MDKHTELPWGLFAPNKPFNEFVQECIDCSKDQMHMESRVISNMHDEKSENYRVLAIIGPGPKAHENAAFIVEACNNHYHLLAENNRLAEALERGIERLRYERSRINAETQEGKAMTSTIDILEEALQSRGNA
jgi:hypothetical protein